jgi:integrase/recombinase XerD
MAQNPADCVSQSKSAKSKYANAIGQICRIARKHGWDYKDWRYVAKRVRGICDLKPERQRKALPRVLTTAEFERFYAVLDKVQDPQHALMLRLLFYTGARVSELCAMKVDDVDFPACKIRINRGKGDKDRYVLFGKSFATALRTHLAGHLNNKYIFQTQRNGKYTPRRVQQIVKGYADEAGVKATPHTFRHQMITWLTRKGKLADAELQLLTGHAKRETLAVYQHVALDDELTRKYQESIKDVDF